ncbi:hypothetical protein [Pseudomonas sp. Q1-7]|uniref:hypothetical protein n=1 Tax=Pseudomonas sp. Q1-7 TaxID=3020843 RepID=UPI0023012FA3|nr:hypothetical protein [Pseudomonas sp. Q1-7]
MADFNTPTALSLLGRTAMVELVWDDDPRPLWVCVHILGVVLRLDGVYEHPHFLTMDVHELEPFPNEMFWTNIRRLYPLRWRDGARGFRPAPCDCEA